MRLVLYVATIFFLIFMGFLALINTDNTQRMNIIEICAYLYLSIGMIRVLKNYVLELETDVPLSEVIKRIVIWPIDIFCHKERA